MGRVIHLQKEKKKSNLLGRVFGKSFFCLPYEKERRELESLTGRFEKRDYFFRVYGKDFFDSLFEVDPYLEFDANYSLDKYFELSSDIKEELLSDCAEIYSRNNRLKYSEFVDLVELYSLRSENKKNSFMRIV